MEYYFRRKIIMLHLFLTKQDKRTIKNDRLPESSCAQREELIKLIDKRIEQYLRLNCMLNNAGISGENTNYLAGSTTENFKNI